jgi:hypothetical protein
MHRFKFHPWKFMTDQELSNCDMKNRKYFPAIY